MSIQVTSQDAKPAAAPETEAKASMTDLAKGEGREEKSAKAEEESADENADESDASEQGDDESNEEAGENDEKPKKKNGGFKKRIDKLSKRLTEKEREAEYWREQAMKAGKTRDQEPREQRRPQADLNDGRPKQDDFDTHEAWVEAVADWKVERKLQEKEAQARRAEFSSKREKQQAEVVSKIESFKAEHDDFDDVVSEVDDIPMSPALEDELLQSENAPALMYELAKDRENYARICRLSPTAVAREIGKLEAKLAKTQETPKEETKTTKAPKPISTVTAKGGSGVKKSIWDKNLSQSDYERIRREQMKERGSW